jgi:glycosyltransferase involved in cell wall biosynthesis
VIIVDDGSTDDTPAQIEQYLKRTTLHVRFERQQNSGPARARNVAISMARAPITLMIGDDIFASPQFVEAHLKLHQERPESQVAGLGLTLWDTQKQKVTPFMRFLEEGTQFAYPALLAGSPPTYESFYTSNLSVKTAVLRHNPFDETFPKAAYEDQELGWRISRTEGLELVFLREALAHHYHPTTFLQACRRMKTVGWSAHLFFERCPETYTPIGGNTAARRAIRKILAPAPILYVTTQITSLLSQFCTPRPLLLAILGTYKCLGYQERELEIKQSAQHISKQKMASS